MGIDPSKEAAIRDYEIREGSLFETAWCSWRRLRQSLGIRLHDEIKVLTRRGLKRRRWSGCWSCAAWRALSRPVC